MGRSAGEEERTNAFKTKDGGKYRRVESGVLSSFSFFYPFASISVPWGPARAVSGHRSQIDLRSALCNTPLRAQHPHDSLGFSFRSEMATRGPRLER